MALFWQKRGVLSVTVCGFRARLGVILAMTTNDPQARAEFGRKESTDKYAE